MPLFRNDPPRIIRVDVTQEDCDRCVDFYDPHPLALAAGRATGLRCWSWWTPLQFGCWPTIGGCMIDGHSTSILVSTEFLSNSNSRKHKPTTVYLEDCCCVAHPRLRYLHPAEVAAVAAVYSRLRFSNSVPVELMRALP